jgi:hypothetical protein
MNKFKNEKVIKLGEVEILLRPTFMNCADLEAGLGYGLPMLAYNLAQKKLPNMTDLAKVIYFCQAERTKSLEEIWDLVQSEGMMIAGPVLEFIGQITAGDKTAPELSESQKKS